MHNKRVTPISLFIIVSLLLLPAQAEEVFIRASQAMQHYSAAQSSWQTGLAELISSKNQSFTDLAIIQRNLQLSMISLRNERFRYLLQKDPKRLTLDKGISKLTNFEWSDKDSKALSAQDPSYAELEALTEELKEINKIQQKWPELRTFFKEEITGTPEYKKLLDEFLSAQKIADEMLVNKMKD